MGYAPLSLLEFKLGELAEPRPARPPMPEPSSLPPL